MFGVKLRKYRINVTAEMRFVSITGQRMTDERRSGISEESWMEQYHHEDKIYIKQGMAREVRMKGQKSNLEAAPWINRGQKMLRASLVRLERLGNLICSMFQHGTCQTD
jgi:hypothetical protein